MSAPWSTPSELLSAGFVLPKLHYGLLAKEWCMQKGNNPTTETATFLYPIRLGQITQFLIKGRQFVLEVVKSYQDNGQFPGFHCCVHAYVGQIETSATHAFETTYGSLFDSKTRISGSSGSFSFI